MGFGTNRGWQRASARPLRRGLLAAAVALATMTPAPAADAAPVQTSPTPLAGWRTDGPVYATAIIGDTVFAGGNFRQVRNQSGTQTSARSNLAAFDRISGALVAGFSADTNGVVRALATDGTRLFVGGSFTTVRGVARQRLAAVSPTTGAVDAGFSANATSHVYALAVQGTRLYVGGGFGAIRGIARPRLAAVATTSGAVDPAFAPSPDLNVRAVAASPDGTSVYAGGEFTAIGGATQNFLAQLSAVTGANTGLVWTSPPAQRVLTLDVSPSSAQVFVGSMANRAAAYRTTTGQRQWYQQADGDVQAIRYRAGNVYFGFHEGFAGDLSVRILAADAATGALTSWRPTVNSFYGVWAIAASDTALVIGGEFTRVNAVATQGIAVLPDTTTDTVAPSPPGNLTVTKSTATTVSLVWTDGSDDVAVGAYRVLRDGVELGYPTGRSYTDPNPTGTAGSTYSVQTVDSSGNRSAAVTVTIDATVSLIRPRSAWRFSDTGTDLGTAWRSPGFSDTSWALGTGEFGYGDGDETTIVGFGPNAALKYRTTYFRQSFTVTDPSTIGALTLELLADDGAVAYVNGVEVVRANMPTGTVGYATRAASSLGPPAEQTYRSFTIDRGMLTAGANLIAVEVHQASDSSSDLSFDAGLEASVQ